MSNLSINQLPTYVGTVDATNDLIPIFQNSSTSTNSVNRNTYLNLASQPVGLTDTQTLSNKTLTSPTINGATLSGTLSGTYVIGGTPTFPSSVVQLTSSQTLTNKVLTSPTINSPTITNATLSADTITGYSAGTTGTIYGIGVTSGVITGAGTVGSAALATNAVQGNQLATTAITLGYAQTTSVFSTSSTTATQVTSLSATVTVPSGGRRVKITVSTRSNYNSSSGAYNTLSLWNGTVGSGTLLMESVFQSTVTNGEGPIPLIFSHVPSSGSITYNVGMKVTAGTGSISVGSPVVPMSILVEAI